MGRPHSEETKAKIRAALKGKPQGKRLVYRSCSEETKARIRAGVLGKLKTPASRYLVLNGPKTSPANLKRKLLEEGLREHKCERCLLTTWMDDAIPLELHHVDGNRRNNLDENIQLLCPNCHTQTPNWGFKGARRRI